MRILVSGASGYVGSKLIPLLVQAGHQVTAMVRDNSKTLSLPPNVQVVIADATKFDSLADAMRGIDVAYYLIHSMSAAGEDFHERDLNAAENFATAARDAGVARLIYLGGLVSSTSEMSKHLRSRQESGEALRKFGPPLTEFRAGIIVGNGSVSFELIRCLTERLPVMICPRWVITRTQPIAIEDVLAYLRAALQTPESEGQIIEIGGSTIETYRSMMLTYARARGLKRWLIRVPILTPRLSSYWLRLVTPIPSSIARPLIEGLRTEVICKSDKAAQLFPSIRPMAYEDAIRKTLNRVLPDQTMKEAIPREPAHIYVRREGVLSDVRQEMTDATPAELFDVLTKLGGANGYLYANNLWRMRGLIDQWVGGVGMKNVLDRKSLSASDSFDFWFVQELDVDRRLLLRAAMKMPGRAWLEFILAPAPHGKTLFRCCAWYEPRGLLGELYWWALYPIHILIFRGLVRAVCRKALSGRRTKTEFSPALIPGTPKAQR